MKQNSSYKLPIWILPAVLLTLGIAMSSFWVLENSGTPQEKFLKQYLRQVVDCASAEKLAEDAIQQGKYRMLITVGMDADLSRMPYTFYQKLQRNYGVEVVNIYNCTGIKEDDCYNEKMQRALVQKFGKEPLIQLYEEMYVAEYGPREKSVETTCK